MTTARRSLLRRLAATAGLGLALAILAGCATPSSSSSLYVLGDNSTAAPDHSPQPGAPTLRIAPVTTAAYLDQSGIVYQTGPHRVVVAHNHRWASPISKQLTDTLYSTLDQQLSNINVVRASDEQQDSYRLRTRIEQFSGHYDGNAHIAGRWTLVAPDGQTLASHAFNRGVPLKNDGYPALVTSLSSGWQSIGHAMARTIERTLRVQ